MIKIMVLVLQMRTERLGHQPVIGPGLELEADSRALILNLALLCFSSLCCKAGFPDLGTSDSLKCFQTLSNAP